MAASTLGIYNAALRHLGERRLASLTEAREPRYALDDEYPNTIAYALEAGYWTFAMRAAEVYAETSMTVEFGFQYAFAKPTDWKRTYQVSTDGNFSTQLNDFKDEAGFWFSNQNPTYFKYVSDDPTYGMNLGLWPQAYAEYVSCLLAMRICNRITQEKTMTQFLMKEVKGLRTDALAKDAMNNGSDRLPSGTWVRSRQGGMVTDRVGSNLIG